MAPHWQWMWILLLGLVTGCASTSVHEDNDPWEDTNRAIFDFNVKLDDAVFAPTARGWTSITNEPVRESISNFFTNVRYPFSLVNNLLQGHAEAAGTETLRFLANTTVGLGGFFDPASSWGLLPHEEDFGQTMGWWGIDSGPYLVLPFYGSSSPRDSFGLLLFELTDIVPGTLLFFVEEINNRSLFLDSWAKERASALDFYAKVRNGYTQSRRNDVLNDAIDGESGEEEDDIYFMDIE